MTVHTVKIACERPDTCGRSLSQWSCQELAHHLVQGGVVTPISRETVRRILRAQRLKPWRKRMGLSAKVARDGTFAACVRHLCDLYTRPLAEHERVLCLDEMTSLQPRPRPCATRPTRPDQPTRVEHEYRRSGALNLLAAFDTRTGQVYGTLAPRKRQVELLALLDLLAAQIPATVRTIYVVLANVPMHTGKKVRLWLAQHPRFVWVHPPVHCSWLNQIEQWFSILRRKRLGLVDFHDLDHLASRITAFIHEWNQQAHTFHWTHDSFAKVLAHCADTISSSPLALPA